jgi:hypothetical protein
VIGFGACTGVAVALVVLAAGCSRDPDAKDAQADLDESRSAVQAEVKDAARVLEYAGFRLEALTGGFETCNSVGLGTATARYGAGGTVQGGGGTRNERIVAATDALSSAGWKARKSGTYLGEAYTRLSRGGLELSLDADQLRGSDAFVVGASSECVQVTDEQANNLPDDEQIVP